jgi:mRNA interferase MazF
MKVKQYEIVFVNLEPTIGSEINKTRPCVVLSPNEMNHHLKTTVIAPITSTLKKYPTRIMVANKTIKGMVAIDQIRTIDKRRIIKTIGILDNASIKQIKKVIQETYVF